MQNFKDCPEYFPVPAGARVLVCGGRNYEDWQLVYAVLDHVKPRFLVTGGQGKGRKNRGADLHAETYAKDRSVLHDVVHADWDAFGRSAGPRRNSEMLIRNPLTEWVIAFPGGKGTADMLRKAWNSDIPAVTIDLDGNYKIAEGKDAD